MKETKKVIEEYKLETKYDNFGCLYKQTAVIRLVDGIFDDCDFSLRGRFSFEDWMFLLEIATKIKELAEGGKGGRKKWVIC